VNKSQFKRSTGHNTLLQNMSFLTLKTIFKITEPLGRKSIPTILSSKEDFPDDCEPTTAIFGSLMNYCKPTSLSSSITLMSFLRFSKSPTPLKSADDVSAIMSVRLIAEDCHLSIQLFVFIFKKTLIKVSARKELTQNRKKD